MSDVKVSLEEASMLYQYYVGWFIFLLAALFVFRKASGSSSSGGQPAAVVTADFKRFQRSYVLVYLIMMGADWLQGPYVYALYKHYGFGIGDIGKLFIVGFGSSLFFGTIVGSMADKYGRKLMCMVFGIMYTASCITKHFPDYNILLVGRVLGGISTSILFSSFESWMVHEHHEASYPEEWLGITFSVCTSGNGIVAIGSGVVASFARDKWGPVAPFDVSMICLVIGTLLVASSWAENTGDSKINFSLTLSNAWNRLQEDRKIALLGLIQSFFEGAMYVFVFMWTPALESTSAYPIYHGWIFASFMICTLIGSGLFKTCLDRGMRVERTAMYMFAVSAFVLVLPNFTMNHSCRLAAFFVFEICVGMFWPSLGFMRSRYVPEEVRATVMNFFRIPLNCIVVIVLYNIDALQPYVFSVCGLCLVLAFICQVQLVKLTVDAPEVGGKKGFAPVETNEMESLSSGH